MSVQIFLISGRNIYRNGVAVKMMLAMIQTKEMRLREGFQNDNKSNEENCSNTGG
jgi:hypothetical protein